MIDLSLIDSLGFLCKEDILVLILLEWEDMWINFLVFYLFGNIKIFLSYCRFKYVYMMLFLFK